MLFKEVFSLFGFNVMDVFCVVGFLEGNMLFFT